MASASSKSDYYKLLKTQNKVECQNTVTIDFELENTNDMYYISHESESFNINGKIFFEFRVISVISTDVFTDNFRYFNTFYVRATNMDEGNKYTSYVLTSKALENDERVLDVGNDKTWRLISMWRTRIPKFEIDVQVSVQDPKPQANSLLAALHEDSSLMDFELRSEDGAVRVHKAVVAAASPVLRAMLDGQWSESQQGMAHVGGTKHSTLINLKDYIYLNKMPEEETDIKKLLLLANYYQMSDLRQRCLHQLVQMITADNLLAMTEFAVKNAITDLHFMILQSVHKGTIELEKVRQSMKTILLD